MGRKVEWIPFRTVLIGLLDYGAHSISLSGAPTLVSYNLTILNEKEAPYYPQRILYQDGLEAISAIATAYIFDTPLQVAFFSPSPKITAPSWVTMSNVDLLALVKGWRTRNSGCQSHRPQQIPDCAHTGYRSSKRTLLSSARRENTHTHTRNGNKKNTGRTRPPVRIRPWKHQRRWWGQCFGLDRHDQLYSGLGCPARGSLLCS